MVQWYGSGVVTGRYRLRNQDDAQMPFGKALIVIVEALGEVLKS